MSPPSPRGSVDRATLPGLERPTTVGALSPSTGGFFFGQVLAGIVAGVASVGGRVVFLQTLDAGQTNDILPETDTTLAVGWDQLDAIVNIAWATSPEYLERFRDTGRPVVLASAELDSLDVTSVVADNTGGVREAVDHLVGHGHTLIGFVGHTGQSDIAARCAAYQEAMRDHGLEPLEVIQSADQVATGGRAAAAAVAATSPRWTAVVAATDLVALGLVSELRTYGIEVPRDLAVVGFDDAEAGWFSDPALTTVRQEFLTVGATAGRLAADQARRHASRHERHTVPATLVVRRSCGCSPSRVEPPAGIEDETRTFVAALGDVLGAPGLADGDSTGLRGPDELDVELIDEVITATIARLFARAPSPEAVDGFAQSAVRRVGALASHLGGNSTGRQTLLHCMSRTAALLSHRQAVRSADRIQRLVDALGAQFDVGMGLLGRALGDDPANLRWLEMVGVRAGCLGLWSGDGQTALRVAGVYDPLGTLDGLVGRTVGVSGFPPAEVLRLADAARNEAAYVIPVRGASGDHGLLCLVAPVDLEFGTPRATYDHWAALLGAALREQRLLVELQHSEERYALASRAAADGLWEWDAATGAVYASARARELLAIPDGPDSPPGLGTLHPDDRERVREAFASAVETPDVPTEVEVRVVHDDGSARWAVLRALGVLGPSGRTAGMVGSISDIDRRKTLEEQLRRAALFDHVTGLPNRRLFLDRLSHALEQPRRRTSARFAVLFLDLDGFKIVNDSLGHLLGDELLQVVGERLRSDLRSVDTAARFGGDEFAVLLTDPVPEDLLVVARRIQRKISAPVLLGDQEVSVTASIGIATSAMPYSDAEDVLRDADIAMYRAKECERGSACIFDPEMHDRALDRLRTRSALHTAIENHQFVVHYQPVVDLADPTVTEFEALVRWNHPERGLLPPAEFLPYLEGNHAIVELGRQVLDQVCAQLAEWRRDHDERVTVAVNLSHREFWAPDLTTTVRQALARHGVPPSALVLETTESTVMPDPEGARLVLDELRQAGVRLRLDGFGTGHSSMHILRTFPVDALKIDGSFVSDLGSDQQTTALVAATVALGRALGIDVHAEWVETTQQAGILQRLGCRAVQGWLYSPAVPAEAAGDLIGTRLESAARRAE